MPIPVRIRLRDAERGVDHIITEEVEPLYLEGGRECSYVFGWEENNFACDCNRSLALSWDMPGYEPRECGHDKVELVSIVRGDTGEILYEE